MQHRKKNRVHIQHLQPQPWPGAKNPKKLQQKQSTNVVRMPRDLLHLYCIFYSHTVCEEPTHEKGHTLDLDSLETVRFLPRFEILDLEMLDYSSCFSCNGMLLYVSWMCLLWLNQSGILKYSNLLLKTSIRTRVPAYIFLFYCRNLVSSNHINRLCCLRNIHIDLWIYFLVAALQKKTLKTFAKIKETTTKFRLKIIQS